MLRANLVQEAEQMCAKFTRVSMSSYDTHHQWCSGKLSLVVIKQSQIFTSLKNF